MVVAEADVEEEEEEEVSPMETLGAVEGDLEEVVQFFRCTLRYLPQPVLYTSLGKEEGGCKLCPGVLESIPSLFAHCLHAWRCWALCSRSFGGLFALGLPRLIDSSVGRDFFQVVKIFVLYEILWALWLGHNGH